MQTSSLPLALSGNGEPLRRARPNPYADAPRVPGGDEAVDLRTLVVGRGLEVEVGPGRGGFLFERAAAVPEVGLVGFEVRRKWATLVDRRLKAQGLGARARVFAEDALHVLPRLGPDGVVDRVFLHFPDPWWKKRHTKRLVMGDRFVQEVVRLLKSGGELYVQTDVADRADQYEERLRAEPQLRPWGHSSESPRMAENPYGARSPREHRAVADGLPVYRMRFQRI